MEFSDFLSDTKLGLMPKNRLARCLWIAAIRGFDPWVNKDRFIVSIPPVYIPQDPHIHVKYNYTLHLRPATFQLPLNFTSNSYFHPDLPLPVVHVSVSAFTWIPVLGTRYPPWNYGTVAPGRSYIGLGECVFRCICTLMVCPCLPTLQTPRTTTFKS